MVIGRGKGDTAMITLTEGTPTAAAELRILGGFELRVDGERIDIQPASQRLLALVALAARGVDRCYAAFQLWPDKGEKRAKANLRSALWRLGKLDAAILDVTNSRLRLHDDVWVDVHHGMSQLRAEGDTTVLDDLLPFHVLAAELLPDWYDDWLVIERERLRQLSLAALEDRAQTALAVGDTSSAIQFGLGAVALDPMRESGHRVVIEAHLHDGNQSEARRQLAHYEAALECDPRIGVSPAVKLLFDAHRASNQYDVAV